MLSIIIPSLNNLNDLKKCILSIENQTYKNVEVWVIDGNSTDGTQSYLKTLRPPFNWVSESDKGIYDAMNKGISLSKGEWLLFLGCDDKIHTDYTLSSVFNEPIEGNTELILGKIKFDWKKTDSHFIKTNDGVIIPYWSKKIWFKNTLPHQGIFYKRSVFDSSKYNLNYTILADYDLNLRIFNSKLKVKIVNEIIAVCGTNGISKNYKWKLYKEEIKLKTAGSSIVLWPFFYLNAVMKYIIKGMGF